MVILHGRCRKNDILAHVGASWGHLGAIVGASFGLIFLSGAMADLCWGPKVVILHGRCRKNGEDGDAVSMFNLI